MRLLPSKKQWQKWSFPSKLTAVGTYVGILALLVAVIFFVILQKQQPSPHADKPDILVEGTLPLHLWEKNIIEPDSRPFFFHRLGLIVKLLNNSDTPARVDLAVLQGCIRLGPIAAESMLPEDQRLPDGLHIDKYFEKHKATIQGIKAFGLIREDSRDVPAFGTGYVGILFPLSAGKTGALLGVPQSISLQGNCDEITNPSPQPAAGQIFRDSSKAFMPGGNWRTHLDFPNDLAAEVRDGRMQLQLFIGSEVFPVEPDAFRKLLSIRWQNWSTLALAQMYEVPDSYYPPRLSN